MTSRKSISRPNHQPRRLRGETLETRRVMAAAVNLSDDGVLAIEGDAENNRIWVATSRSGERLRVSIDGRSADFPAADVATINILAGPGNDSVRVAQNVEMPTRVHGGQGNDRIALGSGPSFANGGEGRDRIRGGSGVNVLFGGAGPDRITGGRDVDYIVGGEGNDILRGRGGDDWIFGDATNFLPEDATDPLEYARENADVNTGNDIIQGGLGDDNIFGGNGNDRIRGGAGNDFLHGGAGRDRILGDRGDDVLIGGEGRDSLRGGLGADVIRARDETVDVIFADAADELIVDEADIVIRRGERTGGDGVGTEGGDQPLESTL